MATYFMSISAAAYETAYMPPTLKPAVAGGRRPTHELFTIIDLFPSAVSAIAGILNWM